MLYRAGIFGKNKTRKYQELPKSMVSICFDQFDCDVFLPWHPVVAESFDIYRYVHVHIHQIMLVDVSV